MNTSAIIFNTLTILIGIGSIVVNIWIARYNVGKNRVIYDVDEVRVDTSAGENCFARLKNQLNKAKYTVLVSYPDPSDGYKKTQVYVLGRVKK